MKKVSNPLMVFVLIVWGIACAGMLFAAETYTMKKGDTLWDLAATKLKDPTLYPVFLELNNISNPRTISVGTVIIMPSEDEAKQLAKLPNPADRKELAKKLFGNIPTSSSTTSSSNANPSTSADSADSNTPDNTASTNDSKLDPSKVSLKNILNSKISKNKLKALISSPEEKQ